MAAIYLDNIVKPKITNSGSAPTDQYNKSASSYTYTDLHLDLKISQNIGNGLNPVFSADFEVDHDKKAISNSIYNIFSCKQGWKVLSPNFFGSLDRFLFEAVTESNANIIGNDIVRSIGTFEPRIELLKLYIKPNKEEYSYEISINYRVKQSGLLDKLEFRFNTQHYSGVNNITVYG